MDVTLRAAGSDGGASDRACLLTRGGRED